MGIMPDERQRIADICREEMEEASRRILERLSKLEYQRSHLSADQFADVRRFYEDLAAKPGKSARKGIVTGDGGHHHEVAS
ncbi:MAG TPA: hypothetical protein VNO70_02590 [Blastocatellia bacterium]|nr:hypothetical protein [Blastocatellia bacterium]